MTPAGVRIITLSDPAAAVGPPPTARTADAGVDSARAWLVVLGTFVSTATAFFITYSFTTFLTAMGDEFGTGSASTSLLFSLTIFFLFALGLPAGRASDRFGPRPVVVVGAAVLVTGLVLTSMVQRIEVGYVTYGLGIGFGVACCYVPVVSQVTGWFEKRRAVALGVAVSGIGFLLAAALIRRAPAMATTDVPDLRTLARNGVFRSMYLSGFLMALGLFVPFVYLKPYAQERGISPGTAATLVSALGVGSLLGRLILGTFASRLGLLRLYQMCFVVLAASFGVWLFAGGNVWLLGLFAFLLGTAYGGYVALSPAAAAELFGLGGLGAVLGALYTASGIGGLIGPPLAGALQDSTDGYTASIVLALAMGVGGVLSLRRAIRLSAA